MTTETPPNVRGNNKQDKVRKPKRTTQQRLEASLDVAKRKYDRAVAKVHDLEAKTKDANEAVRAAEQRGASPTESAIEPPEGQRRACGKVAPHPRGWLCGGSQSRGLTEQGEQCQPETPTAESTQAKPAAHSTLKTDDNLPAISAPCSPPVVRDNGVAGGVGNQMQVTQSTPQTLSVRVRDGGALLGDPADELYWYDNPSDFTFDDFAALHTPAKHVSTYSASCSTPQTPPTYTAASKSSPEPQQAHHNDPSHNHGDNFVELAQVRIPGGASRIVSGNITDTRSYIERTTYQQLRDSLIFTGIARRSLDPARNQITVNVPATNIPGQGPDPNLRVISTGGNFVRASGTATLTTNLTAGRVLIVSATTQGTDENGTVAIDSNDTSATINSVRSTANFTVATLSRSGSTVTLTGNSTNNVGYTWSLLQG